MRQNLSHHLLMKKSSPKYWAQTEYMECSSNIMDEVKVANCLLLGIVILMLFTYVYTLKISLGNNITTQTQIIAAINA